MQKNIKRRFLLCLCLVLAGAFALLSWLNYRNAKFAAYEELKNSSIPLLRENIYSEIQNELLPALQVASVMAHDTFLIQWAEEGELNLREVERYLSLIKDQYGYFTSFFVSGLSNNYYYYGGINKQVDPSDSHDIWYYDFVSSGLDYDLDVDSDEINQNSLTIFINHRVEDEEGRFLGVTGVGIRMDNFSRMLRSKQENYQRDIYLVDRQGVIQAHSNTQLVERFSLLERQGLRDLIGSLLSVSEEPLDFTYRHEGRKILISSRYIPEIDWFIVVEQEEQVLLATARKNFLRTWIIAFAAMACAILVLQLVFHRFSEEIEAIATTDKLTGLANRRQFEQAMEGYYSRYSRGLISLSLILFDLDHFKTINDSLGHQGGDLVLQSFADLIKEEKRPHDLLARWGGDEFVLLVEGHEEEAHVVAKRILEKVQREHPLMSHLEQNFTCSGGVAEVQNDEPWRELLNKADRALYAAKGQGRNRINRFSDL